MKKGLSKILLIIIVFIIFDVAIFAIYKTGLFNKFKEVNNSTSSEKKSIGGGSEVKEQIQKASSLSDKSLVQSAVTMYISDMISKNGNEAVITPGSINAGTAYFTINGKKFFINKEALKDLKLPSGNWNIDEKGVVTGQESIYIKHE